MPKVLLQFGLWSQLFLLEQVSFTFWAHSPQSFLEGESCWKGRETIGTLGIGYIFYFFAFSVVTKENPPSITLIKVHRAPIYSLPNTIRWVWILIYVSSMLRCYIFLAIIWALLFIISPQWRSYCNELWYTDIFHLCWYYQIYCNYSWKGWSNLLKSHCGKRNSWRRFSLNFLWSCAKIFCSKSLKDYQPA